MIDVREQEQEKLWDSILTLANIDTEKAKVVFRVVIERSLREVNMFTPLVSDIPLKLPSYEDIQILKKLEKQINQHLIQKEEEKAYEFLVEYIEVFSNLTEIDSKIIRKRLIASILSQRQKKPTSILYQRNEKKTLPTVLLSDEEDEQLYYKPKEVAKRLGISDQTVRRMCDNRKFPGAYQTDGGHWKIPKEALITKEEQDNKAEHLFHKLDEKNKEAGEVDEFDL